MNENEGDSLRVVEGSHGALRTNLATVLKFDENTRVMAQKSQVEIMWTKWVRCSPITAKRDMKVTEELVLEMKISE